MGLGGIEGEIALKPGLGRPIFILKYGEAYRTFAHVLETSKHFLCTIVPRLLRHMGGEASFKKKELDKVEVYLCPLRGKI